MKFLLVIFTVAIFSTQSSWAKFMSSPPNIRAKTCLGVKCVRDHCLWQTFYNRPENRKQWNEGCKIFRGKNRDKECLPGDCTIKCKSERKTIEIRFISKTAKEAGRRGPHSVCSIKEIKNFSSSAVGAYSHIEVGSDEITVEIDKNGVSSVKKDGKKLSYEPGMLKGKFDGKTIIEPLNPGVIRNFLRGDNPAVDAESGKGYDGYGVKQ